MGERTYTVRYHWEGGAYYQVVPESKLTEREREQLQLPPLSDSSPTKMNLTNMHHVTRQWIELDIARMMGRPHIRAVTTPYGKMGYTCSIGVVTAVGTTPVDAYNRWVIERDRIVAARRKVLE